MEHLTAQAINMKTLKKILILFIIFISQNNEIKAQNDKKYSAFHKLITVNREVFLSEDFYNKTIVFLYWDGC